MQRVFANEPELLELSGLVADHEQHARAVRRRRHGEAVVKLGRERVGARLGVGATTELAQARDDLVEREPGQEQRGADGLELAFAGVSRRLRR